MPVSPCAVVDAEVRVEEVGAEPAHAGAVAATPATAMAAVAAITARARREVRWCQVVRMSALSARDGTLVISRYPVDVPHVIRV